VLVSLEVSPATWISAVGPFGGQIRVLAKGAQRARQAPVRRVQRGERSPLSSLVILARPGFMVAGRHYAARQERSHL